MCGSVPLDTASLSDVGVHPYGYETIRVATRYKFYYPKTSYGKISVKFLLRKIYYLVLKFVKRQISATYKYMYRSMASL